VLLRNRTEDDKIFKLRTATGTETDKLFDSLVLDLVPLVLCQTLTRRNFPEMTIIWSTGTYKYQLSLIDPRDKIVL